MEQQQVSKDKTADGGAEIDMRTSTRFADATAAGRDEEDDEEKQMRFVEEISNESCTGNCAVTSNLKPVEEVVGADNSSSVPIPRTLTGPMQTEKNIPGAVAVAGSGGIKGNVSKGDDECPPQQSMLPVAAHLVPNHEIYYDGLQRREQQKDAVVTKVISSAESDTKNETSKSTFQVKCTKMTWMYIVGTILMIVGLAFLLVAFARVLSSAQATDPQLEVSATPTPAIVTSAILSPSELVDGNDSCRRCPPS